jgi:hypothetical protein
MTRPGTHLHWLLAFTLVATGVVSGVVLYCFDPSQGGIYPVCLFHRMTGLLCPGCGSLRAIHQLLHGHLAKAFQLNPLLVSLMPFCLVYGLGVWRLGRTRVAQVDGGRVPSGKWIWLGLGLGVAFTIWRNIPGTFFWNLPG